MRNSFHRLLITLVLLAVACTAAWMPAHAQLRNATLGVSSTASAAVTIGARPGMQPANGEPDAGSTKSPPSITGRSLIYTDADSFGVLSGGWGSWFSRISMIWVARYLGTR